MDILYWAVLLYTGLTAVVSLMLWAVSGVLINQTKKDQTAIITLVRQRDLTRAMAYCEQKSDQLHIAATKIMLRAAERPYTIPLVVDVAMHKVKPLGAAKAGGRVSSILNIVNYLVIAYLAYSSYPDSAMMKACAGSMLLFGTLFQMKMGAMAGLRFANEEYILDLRNELLLLTNHIPPMYRAYTGASEDLGRWRTSILEIERDVLLGQDPATASNSAIKRVMDIVESATYTQAGEVIQRSPSGKLDLLTWE